MTAATISSTPRQRWTALIALLLIAAMWGSTFFLVKDATANYSLLTFLVLRWSIAALALLPFCLMLRRYPTRLEWRWGLGAGVLFALGYVLQVAALRVSDSGRVGFVTGLYVVLVPVLALITLRYPIKRRIWISGALAVAGMVLLANAPGGSVFGDVIALLSAVSFAAQILVIEKFPKGMDWRFVSLLQAAVVAAAGVVLLPIFAAFSGCSGALCALIAPFADPLPTSLPLNVVLVAVFTGVVASGLGLVIQVWAQRLLPPSEAALMYSAESPFAAVYGVMFRGEVLTVNAVIGCGLLFAGMVVVSLGGAFDASAANRRPHPMRPRTSARLTIQRGRPSEPSMVERLDELE
ncbi:MAG: DMT family transporter [Anaerolineae bacterium]|nr:DMT family transporter [Anaerolineae bacterium]